jgi:hypothetical protein
LKKFNKLEEDSDAGAPRIDVNYELRQFRISIEGKFDIDARHVVEVVGPNVYSLGYFIETLHHLKEHTGADSREGKYVYRLSMTL